MTIKLSNDDFRTLLRVVRELPRFSTYTGRFTMLNEALEGSDRKGDILYHINLEGEPAIVASEVITRLISFGQVVSGKEALSIFLNQVLLYKGEGEDTDFIRSLFVKYPLDVPISAEPKLGQWKGTETAAEVQEKIIGENTLRPIHVLLWALRAARAVARLTVTAKNEVGSGFMVAPDLIMTNNHVISNQAEAESTEYLFNYQLDENEKEAPVQMARAVVGGLFHTNADLDYSVVQLRDLPDLGEPLVLKSALIERDKRVSIIQHPAGHFKKISLQNNFVAYADAKVVQYTTSTLPGSSGSPVFDDLFDVVAIHHSGGNLIEPSTGRRYLRNEGICMMAVLNDLKANAPDIYKQVRKA